MRLLKDKKAQWVRMMMREQRSADRRERVYQTYLLTRQNLSPEKIAIELGVSSNTVKTYIAEINADEAHFEEIYNQDKLTEENRKREEQRKIDEEIVKHNRTIKEIIWGEIWGSVGWSIFISLILYIALESPPHYIFLFIATLIVLHFFRVLIIDSKNMRYRALRKVISHKVDGKNKMQHVNIKCPACDNELEFEIDEDSKDTVIKDCPVCNHSISASVGAKLWVCDGCGKEFPNKEQADMHTEKCTKNSESHVK